MKTGNRRVNASVNEPAEYLRAYLAEIGRRGGETSRRFLSKQHARRMVGIREWKRARLKAGKSWPPTDRKSRRLLKLNPKHGRPTPTLEYRKRLPFGGDRIPGWY